MGNGFCRLQEVIAVARYQDQLLRAGVSKNLIVPRINRKRFPQARNLVAEGLQGERHVVGDIVIEQELHSASGTIWRAARTSISPRWSS